MQVIFHFSGHGCHSEGGGDVLLMGDDGKLISFWSTFHRHVTCRLLAHATVIAVLDCCRDAPSVSQAARPSSDASMHEAHGGAMSGGDVSFKKLVRPSRSARAKDFAVLPLIIT